ncbi:MAG: hypothetical protein ACJATT_004174 [Myxococcota bacterium]|jgi:hypothetical protein
MRWWGGVGLCLVIAGLLCLLLEIPGLNTAWFLFGWVGTLVVLDACIATRGSSFFWGRRRELLAMAMFSMAYWTVYEQLNLRLENWYYVFVPRSDVWQALYGGLAFATVLPACFFPAELLRVWGVWSHWTTRPLRVSSVLEGGLLVFGTLCIVLPMVAPQQCFWMVWGAPLGIPLVINRRVGAQSLLRDLELGQPGRLARLLVGGLIAGGLWESLNFWAHTKWVYTVPGFETGKIFEMPWLGFVGFPVLSVASFSIYALWCHVARGGRHWEVADDQQPSVQSRHRAVAMAALVVFSVTATLVPLTPAITMRPTLSDIDSLSLRQRQVLRQSRWSTPERLAVANPFVVEAETGLPRTALAPTWHYAQIMVHRGMGAVGARWLAQRDILTIAELGESDADALVAQLTAEEEATLGIREDHIRVWVRGARGGVLRR